MKIKNGSVAFIFLLVLSKALGSSPSPAAKWKPLPGPMSRNEILGLFKFAEGNTDAEKVITDSLKLIGSDDPGDLSKWVAFCVLQNDVVADYHFKPVYYIDQIKSHELLNPYLIPKQAADLKAKLINDGSLLLSEKVHKDYIDGYRLSGREKICISTKSLGASLTQISRFQKEYLIVIHELIHFSRSKIELAGRKFLEKYEDRDSYIKDIIMSPGGEFEAYTIMFENQIRLEGGIEGLPEDVRGAFNNQGELTDKDAFYKAILAMGYQEILTLDYVNRLQEERVNAKTLLSRLGDIKRERQGYYLVEANPILDDSMSRLDSAMSELIDLISRFNLRIQQECSNDRRLRCL